MARYMDAEKFRRVATIEDEAVVPSQLTTQEIQRERFIDSNGYRHPDSLLNVFDYTNYYKPFTTQEGLNFAQAFKRSPKDFGAIVEYLPDRTAAECVRYYNDHKSDGRFKMMTETAWLNKLAQKESMYDYGDSDEPPPPPAKKGIKGHMVDAHIKQLRDTLGNEAQPLYTRDAGIALKGTVLPLPDLTLVRQGLKPPFNISDGLILKLLRSNEVLPLIKQWLELCSDESGIKAQMQEMLPADFRPWDMQLSEIAADALRYKDSDFDLPSVLTYREAYVLCAHHASKVVASNQRFSKSFKPYGLPEIEQYIFAVAALLTAYDEVTQDKDNFFGILLESPLAKVMGREQRKTWETKFRFEGEQSEAEYVKQQSEANRTILSPRFSSRNSQLTADHLSTRRSTAAPSLINMSNKHTPLQEGASDHGRGDRNESDSNQHSDHRGLEEEGYGEDEYDEESLEEDENREAGDDEGSSDSKGNESDHNDSDETESDDAIIAEPADEAGRMYKAKAEGLYIAMVKKTAELNAVKKRQRSSRRDRAEAYASLAEAQAERDWYKARLQEVEEADAEGPKRNRRKTPRALKKAEIGEPEMARMVDDSTKLWRERKELESAVDDTMLSVEDAVRAALQAGYVRRGSQDAASECGRRGYI